MKANDLQATITGGTPVPRKTACGFAAAQCDGGLHKKCFYCTEERGQAHLPDPELIGVELLSPENSFQRKAIEQVPESQGLEGGLAPALPPVEGLFVQSMRRQRPVPRRR